MANQLPILKIKTIPITEVNVKEKEVLIKVTTSSKEDLLNHKKLHAPTLLQLLCK